MFGNIARLFIILFCIDSELGLELRAGTPVPHADDLKRMIVNYVFRRPSDVNGDAILNYVLGKSDTIPDPEKELRRLNISLLDPIGLGNLARFVKLRNWDEHVELEAKVARRQNVSLMSGRRAQAGLWLLANRSIHQAWYMDHPDAYKFIRQGLGFMQQAVYSTRYSLKRTKPFRKRYQNNYLFHLGTQFGMLMQIRIKMETSEFMLNSLSYYWTRFHWFLMLYARIMQAHIDVDMTVQRMFELYRRFKARRNNPAFAYFYTNEMDKDTK